MSRFTKNNLKQELQRLNTLLADKGSKYSFKYEGRNGYHAVDLMKGDSCLRCLDCAEPPRMLAMTAENEYYRILTEL